MTKTRHKARSSAAGRMFRRAVFRWAKPILAASALLSIAGGYFSVRLFMNLRTDIEELLPVTSRSVVDLNVIISRLVATDNLGVIVLSDDVKASRRFVDDLAERLKQVPPSVISHIEYRIDRELEFFRRRQALYIDIKDLREIRSYISKKISYERELYNPLNIFRSNDIPEPLYNFDGLQRKHSSKISDYTHFPDGYYATQDEKVRMMLLFRSGENPGFNGAKLLKDAVEKAIAEVNPAKYAPDLEIKFTSGIQDLIEEQSSLMSDLGLSTVIVAVLVTVSMFVYFASFLATTLSMLSLFAGALWTFGISYFVVGYLNANSAFMGSIVLGNGVNFGIIYLARYLEERGRRKGVLHAVMAAQRRTAGGTVVAALAAGLAYGALMLTSFRGFSQFGVIGLIGMVLCWISAYTLLPALLVTFDRRPPSRRVLRAEESRPVAEAAARFVARFPKQILWASAILSCVALFFLKDVSLDLIEADLTKLRDKKSMESGSGYNGMYQDQVFQRYLSPLVVLAEERSDVPRLQRALEKLQKRQEKKYGVRLIENVRSMDDFVPRDQDEKIALLRAVAAEIAAVPPEEVPEKDRKLAREYLDDAAFEKIALDDIPPLIRSRFSERDGSVGKMVLVEPPLSGITYDRTHLINLVTDVRKTIDKIRPGTPVAGQLAVSSDVIGAITEEGPLATAFAFGAVILLVTLLFRNARTILLCLVALLVGIAWLGGTIVAFGWKINFLNFVALPITFGIGVDYGVNVFARYRLEGAGQILRVIRNTGGAVALASLTTIIGFGSLLLASNQAFYSLGRLAVIGEVTCLSAALLTLPALLLVLDRKRAAKSLAPAAVRGETREISSPS